MLPIKIIINKKSQNPIGEGSTVALDLHSENMQIDHDLKMPVYCMSYMTSSKISSHLPPCTANRFSLWRVQKLSLQILLTWKSNYQAMDILTIPDLGQTGRVASCGAGIGPTEFSLPVLRPGNKNK